MRKYCIYKSSYKELNFEYFITTRTYWKNIERNLVIAKIKTFDGKTLKYMEIPLLAEYKLNKELQNYIEKYIIDFCENKLKEVLL